MNKINFILLGVLFNNTQLGTTKTTLFWVLKI